MSEAAMNETVTIRELGARGDGIAADGTLSGAKIVRTSGSDEFDRAVLAAFAHVRTIGPRPDKKSELLTLNFRMREE